MHIRLTVFLTLISLITSMTCDAGLNIDSLVQTAGASSGEKKIKTLGELRKYYKQRDPEMAAAYARQSLKEAIASGLKEYQASSLNDLAVLFSMMHRPDTAMILLKESLAIYTQINDPEGIAKVSSNIGINYAQIGYYEIAIEYYLEAAKHYHGKPQNLAKVYLNLGLVYEKASKYDLAGKYLLKARFIADSLHDEKMFADASINLGIVSRSQEKYNLSHAYLSDALKIYSDQGTTYEMAVVYMNLSQTFKAEKNFTQALRYAYLSLPLIRKTGSTWAEASLFADIAEINFALSKPDSAIVQLNTALTLNKQNKGQELEGRIHQLYYRIFKSMNSPNEALQHYEQYVLIHDSLFSIGRAKAIEEVLARYKSMENEAEKMILQKEIQGNQFRLWALAGFSLVGFLLSVLILAIYNYHKKRAVSDKNMAEKERALTLIENELQEIRIREILLENGQKEDELKKVQLEYQMKDQELVYQTLCRMDLMHINRTVQEKLSPFQYLLTRKKDQDEFLKVLNNINADASRDAMSDFEVTFTQLHRGFYETLLGRFPDLSKTELTVAALIRLNLSSKDVARLLNLSVNTIEITRHHIRKKLELDPKESLTAFLITI